MSGGAEIAIALPAVLAEAIGRAVAEQLNEALARAEQACAARQRQEAAATEARRCQEAALTGMVNLTRVNAAQDATRAFLREGVQRLLANNTLAPAAREQCQTLARRLDAIDAPLTELTDAYYAMLPQARASAQTAAAPSTALDQAFAAVEAMLDIPLLKTQASAAPRARWRQRLAALRALGATAPAMAEQGLATLRRQLARALQEQAARADARQAAAAELRALLAKALPQLQVVVEEAPDALAAQAKALLSAIASELVRETPDPDALRAQAQEADALFAATRAALEEQLRMEALAEQVSEVLVSLGYRVDRVPGAEDGALVAPLTADYGVAFQMDGAGRLATEMVALSPAAAVADAEEQERVCALVDALVARLRARNCTVRERTRRHFTDGETLRVVEAPTAHTAARTSRTRQGDLP